MFFEQLIVGLTVGATYSLIAIGFSLIFRAAGLLNFAHPDTMMIGAMVGYTVTTRGWPLPMAVVVGALASSVAAVVVDQTAISPIRRRRGPIINQIIATLGWSIILANAAMLIWGPHPIAYPPTLAGVMWKVSGVPIALQNVFILGAGVLIMFLLQLFFKRARLGYAMRATADDPETALLMGIDTRRILTATMVLAGALAGMAGVFIASLFYASFDLGTFGLRTFAAAVLGGFGDVVGAMLGGLILGVAETLGAAYFASAYRDVIAFGIAILVLLVRPHGLLGRGRRTV